MKGKTNNAGERTKDAAGTSDRVEKATRAKNKRHISVPGGVLKGAKGIRKSARNDTDKRPDNASATPRTNQRAGGKLQIAPSIWQPNNSDAFQQEIETVDLTKWIIVLAGSLAAVGFLLGVIIGKLG